ncbi:MAG: hypothetical protein ABI871_02540 [Chthoniobacterales bacterium]
MLSTASRVYPLLGLCGGYAIVMLSNPIRLALRDGLRCILRFKRIWLTFALLGFAYTVFQVATFTPVQRLADLDFSQFGTLSTWQWPHLADVWRETPLPVLEAIAGLFDNATTTYPLSVVGAILLAVNWKGLHGDLLQALRKRYRFWSYLIYLVVLVSAFAALCKPIVFWRLPYLGASMPAASLLQVSATVDAVAFIFEYLVGVYIQVYLITVCLAWVKGLSFTEEALFHFAVRRFAYVLRWAGVVVFVSICLVRVPLLVSYFRDVPGVLDYLPLQRVLMSGLIILFSSVQISLALHNETLREAIRAHRDFLRRNSARFGWFLLICALHFWALIACDAIMRGAVADRVAALIGWKLIYVLLRGLLTGWLLAAWVSLFRQCESGRVTQESRIKY